MSKTALDSLFRYPLSRSFYNLGTDFFSIVQASPLRSVYWAHLNIGLAEQLGIDTHNDNRDQLLAILNGQQKVGAEPAYAMVYAGHQFGGFSPQLGDGRALMIAQIETGGGLYDLQLKGAGQTPYSRFGDGRAVLRSSIREYLAGEAMHQLGIASTRALALLGSREPIQREQIETGAIVARVARSHIRFGHFEYFFYSQQYQQLQTLCDYVIQQFLPEAVNAKDKYHQLLQMAVQNTATMIAHWQSIGFAHGVMNTDNMSIIGETLDYGPYGFLDDYEPGFICNHSDHTGRYAFDQQPSIGLWNLNALAHALSPLIETDDIRGILASYEPTLIQAYSGLMRKKLGLQSEKQEDQALCAELLQLMAKSKADYTLSFRYLADLSTHTSSERLDQFFSSDSSIYADWQHWCQGYLQRLSIDNAEPEERQQQMLNANPKYIPRNYLLQRAIEKAQQQDHSEIDTLFTLFQKPFDEHPGMEHYAEPPPAWGKHLSISCSS